MTPTSKKGFNLHAVKLIGYVQKDFISVTNFEGDDREVLKHMIQRIGAQYTSYLTAHNSALVAKTYVTRL